MIRKLSFGLLTPRVEDVAPLAEGACAERARARGSGVNAIVAEPERILPHLSTGPRHGHATCPTEIVGHSEDEIVLSARRDTGVLLGHPLFLSALHRRMWVYGESWSRSRHTHQFVLKLSIRRHWW